MGITCTAVLKTKQLIAGEHIPIVPVFGEWGFVEDKGCMRGSRRLTKRRSARLRNADYVVQRRHRGPYSKKKPFFWPEQIAGFEHMYDGNDDDYPYYLLNRTDENNGEMPTQPLACAKT